MVALFGTTKVLNFCMLWDVSRGILNKGGLKDRLAVLKSGENRKQILTQQNEISFIC